MVLFPKGYHLKRKLQKLVLKLSLGEIENIHKLPIFQNNSAIFK